MFYTTLKGMTGVMWQEITAQVAHILGDIKEPGAISIRPEDQSGARGRRRRTENVGILYTALRDGRLPRQDRRPKVPLGSDRGVGIVYTSACRRRRARTARRLITFYGPDWDPAARMQLRPGEDREPVAGALADLRPRGGTLLNASSPISNAGRSASITACSANTSRATSTNSSSASTAAAPGMPPSAPCSASPRPIHPNLTRS